MYLVAKMAIWYHCEHRLGEWQATLNRQTKSFSLLLEYFPIVTHFSPNPRAGPNLAYRPGAYVVDSEREHFIILVEVVGLDASHFKCNFIKRFMLL